MSDLLLGIKDDGKDNGGHCSMKGFLGEMLMDLMVYYMKKKGYG